MNAKNVWIIIPARNEQSHIASVVRTARSMSTSPIVVVDDGSTDRTREDAQRAGAIVLSHAINLGKGAAMKTGVQFALSQGAQACIFLDGDGQHKPEEIPSFIAALNAGNDVVFGTRQMRKSMPLERRLGSLVLRSVLRTIYNVQLDDPLSGYRAITKKAYAKIAWTSRDYGVESEMIARVGKESVKYTQIPISTIYHDRYKGMNVFDGMKIVFHLIWWRMTH